MLVSVNLGVRRMGILYNGKVFVIPLSTANKKRFFEIYHAAPQADRFKDGTVFAVYTSAALLPIFIPDNDQGETQAENQAKPEADPC